MAEMVGTGGVGLAPGEVLASAGGTGGGAGSIIGTVGVPGAPLGSAGNPGSGSTATGSTSMEGGGIDVDGNGPGVSNGADAGEVSAPPAPACDPCPCGEGPFGDPEPVLGLALDLPSFGPAPSADGLTLLFSAIGETEDIFFATRENRGGRFAAAALVPGLSTDSTEEGTPFLTADGRQIYFFSTRPGPEAVGDRDLWVATAAGDGFASPTQLPPSFAAPEVVPGVNHDGLDHLPRLSADGLSLMFVSGRDGSAGASNIWVAERPSLDRPFGEPTELQGVNTDAREEGFWLSQDGLTLYFASNRSADDGMDIFVAVRPDRDSAFEEAQNLAVVNTPGIEIDPALTLDGFELFFASDRSGTMQLYRSARRCP